MALGFYERSSHGLRILRHSGDTQWFHADLALVPSERLGVFVSYNTDAAAAPGLAPLPFLRTFLDHYYPTPRLAVASGADMRARALQASGEYRFNRMSYTTLQKAFSLPHVLRGRHAAGIDRQGALVGRDRSIERRPNWGIPPARTSRSSRRHRWRPSTAVAFPVEAVSSRPLARRVRFVST